MPAFPAPDGARLHYTDEGAGLPILALAGLSRNASDFDYLAPHLPIEPLHTQFLATPRPARELTLRGDKAIVLKLTHFERQVLQVADQSPFPRLGRQDLIRAMSLGRGSG